MTSPCSYVFCRNTVINFSISAFPFKSQDLHITSKFARVSTMISTEACDSFEPPLAQTISTLLKEGSPEISNDNPKSPVETQVFEDQDCHEFTDLPLIDISRLSLEEGRPERKACEREIAKAARDWGFFQIVNHGIPARVLEEMKEEQKEVFRQPFEVKRAGAGKLQSLGADSYRWGNPTATCLRQLSWSEAFHIPITDIARIEDESLRYIYILHK